MITSRPVISLLAVAVIRWAAESEIPPLGRFPADGGRVKIDRLFRAIVLGGGLAASGCTPTQVTPADPPNPAKNTPAKTTSTESSKSGLSDKAKSKLDCATLCDYPTAGSEVLCPDTAMGDEMNCCWLMAERHPCCDERPAAPTKSRN
ncbi:MAG: hypothetical protein VX223_03640 [Myxococcota bacterium]|nr:hypothetical protein [Myxococcota bacterium]